MPYYNLEEELQYDLEMDDKIHIYPDNNICTTCGKPYTHRKTFSNKVDGLKSVEFITAHPGCRNINDKIKKLKEELLELEFKLFCKRI